jgi:hypothetical protein
MSLSVIEEEFGQWIAIGIVNKIERILVRSAQVQFDSPRHIERVGRASRDLGRKLVDPPVAVVGQLKVALPDLLWIDTRIVAPQNVVHRAPGVG